MRQLTLNRLGVHAGPTGFGPIKHHYCKSAPFPYEIEKTTPHSVDTPAKQMTGPNPFGANRVRKRTSYEHDTRKRAEVLKQGLCRLHSMYYPRRCAQVYEPVYLCTGAKLFIRSKVQRRFGFEICTSEGRDDYKLRMRTVKALRAGEAAHRPPRRRRHRQRHRRTRNGRTARQGCYIHQVRIC